MYQDQYIHLTEPFEIINIDKINVAFLNGVVFSYFLVR